MYVLETTVSVDRKLFAAKSFKNLNIISNRPYFGCNRVFVLQPYVYFVLGLTMRSFMVV